jgi:hypothetical protein
VSAERTRARGIRFGAVRVVDIRERSWPISRFGDPALPTGGLTTSVVAVTTDARRDGAAVIGYGFGSFGRYAQSGLIRERFAPRLLAVGRELDPFTAWQAMMAGEKPGGHGERCVAIGALDMALWDASAKAAGLPLHRHLADVLPQARPSGHIVVDAAGGYRYPSDDLKRLREEARRLLDFGYTMLKIKVGVGELATDLHRIEAVLDIVGGPEHLAVDAMNNWGGASGLEAVSALTAYGLRWLEDVGDPHISRGWRGSPPRTNLPSPRARRSSRSPRRACWIGMAGFVATATSSSSTPCTVTASPASSRSSGSSRRPAGHARRSGRMAATSSASTSWPRSASAAPR